MGLQQRMHQKAASAPYADHRGWTRPQFVLGDHTEGLSDDPGCVGVHHGIGQYEVVQAVRTVCQMADGGQDTPYGAQLLLLVVYESTDAPGTGTWLFTTFVYGKSAKYEDICWEDGQQVRKGAKMISSLSSVGGAEASVPALRHAQHKEVEYKQKQELGCLGGRTYVMIEDDGDEEPPCAMPRPRTRSKLEHQKKPG